MASLLALAVAGACAAPPSQPIVASSADGPSPVAAPTSASTERASAPMVDALVVELTILHSTIGDHEVAGAHSITELYHGSLVRMERGSIGIVPAITLLWDFERAKGWMLDTTSGAATPLTMAIRDVTPASRDVVATELGLRLDARGGLVVPDPPLEPVVAAPPEQLPPGVTRGEAFRVRDAATDHEVVLWVAQGLPLTSRHYADAWRRRMPPPWTAAEQRLLDALDALPGYPVEVRIQRNGWNVVHRVLSARVEPRDATLFAVNESAPDTRDIDLFVARHEEQRADAHQQGRTRLGLDKPFEPTPQSPLPPPLPGGHCTTSALPHSCIEAWDGLEALFTENCDGAFDFAAPCKRERLRGICESPQRTVLRYDYVGSAADPVCNGRWYAVGTK
ncbi:MAG: hypothetical protein JNL21_21865 [Myxococcales bacterium]|nr:hypothetical protein [Myxococcales bacterium]